jgi:hypothetical protein
VTQTDDGRRVTGIGGVRWWRICRRRYTRVSVLVCVLVAGGCGQRGKEFTPSVGDSEWHEFNGTWTAAGNRQMLGLGGERRASIARFEGSLVLEGSSRPGIGFRAEVIVLNDTATGMTGRAVWTDERGDQVFSELKGEGTAAGNKIVGTFLGGTGRYAGAAGTYEFSWRFVLENEDGAVQGQSVGLKGRVRVGASQPTSKEEGAKS